MVGRLAAFEDVYHHPLKNHEALSLKLEALREQEKTRSHPSKEGHRRKTHERRDAEPSGNPGPALTGESASAYSFCKGTHSEFGMRTLFLLRTVCAPPT